MMRNGLLHLGPDAGFRVFDVDGPFCSLRGCCFWFSTLPGRFSGDQPVPHPPRPAPRAVAPLVAGIGWRQIAPLSIQQITQLI